MKKTLFLMIMCATAFLAAQEVKMNDTLKTIFARKSVRSYTEAAVSKAQLELLLKAGMAAPTAVDKRPWEFVVITDKALLKKMAEVLPYAKMAEKAGAAIIIAGDIEKQFGGREGLFWIMDCSAATQNILLAAESLGLGAVWTAVYPDAARVEAVRKQLGLPSYIVPLAFVPIGVPAGGEKPKDKYNPAQIHWNKW